jgi:hypothetical protein
MKLGTWTTIDCPTKQQNEALEWLVSQFEKIDGQVRLQMNPHDFGEYPSFEINYPTELEDIDADEDYENDADQQLALKKSEWHDKANEIEEKYHKKFQEYL